MTTNDQQWLITLFVLIFIAWRLNAIKHILKAIRDDLIRLLPPFPEPEDDEHRELEDE